ncbi:MAG: ABC transporter transmembrane domain-containing protein, partial [Actinomycetes bacterium]
MPPLPPRHSATSLWRMRSYVRPYLAPMVVMLLAASAATGASIVIPLVTKAIVDGPLVHGDSAALWPLVGLALLLGLLEAALVFCRRWTQAYAALGLETQVRDDLYQHLQRLPLEFHDRWQSGQLLSRATADLSTI